MTDDERIKEIAAQPEWKKQRFWISWEQPGEDSRPIAGSDKLGPWLLGWWESGIGDGYCTVVAWVEAKSLNQAHHLLAGSKAWPEFAGAHIRFENETEPGWMPSDRFPLSREVQP